MSTLNPSQKEAVLAGDGPLLVLAGAGSGKTRVITYRIATLLERGVSPDAICAVTFTNKAAGEMRERVAHMVGDRRAGDIWISTFHSLGLAMLKAEARALGFSRGFTIYDSSDQLGVLREILRNVQMDDRRFDIKAILHRISRAKNAFVRPDEYEADPDDDYDVMTRELYPRYQRALRSFAAVDFDDLIVEPVRLLGESAAVKDRWGRRFTHLLVDEYQDTNRAQLLLMTELADRTRNITVVGDDDQSIYAWRGAEASNILEFEKHFPGARIVKLEQNYRSTPNILDCANAVIKNNAVRHEKALFSHRPRGRPVQVVACQDPTLEAKFVCDEIERLRHEERRRYGEVAVLYRSNVQARHFEEALRERRIPYDLQGGQKFYDRKEVKDLMAYLKLALNPRDEIALRRVVNYPSRGIGLTTLERAAEWAAQNGSTVWDALRKAEPAGIATRPQIARAISGFVHVIVKAQAGVKAGRAAQSARALVEDIGLLDDLRAASPSLAAAQRRIDNVMAFLRSLERYEDGHRGPQALREYLHLLTLDSRDEEAETSGDHVTLTTIHGAKGLEWPVVFLVGVEEEIMPHARTLVPRGPDVEGEADISEERRLAYVAITRAREVLYLSRCMTRVKHGKVRPCTPSRFLQEIPEALVETRDLVAEAETPVDADELLSLFAQLSK